MWSSILKHDGNERGHNGPRRALLYLMRFGEDSTRLVRKALFLGKEDRDLSSTLCGVSFSTWEPLVEDPSAFVDIWELNSEATIDTFREIYNLDGRVMYVLAVDSSESVCTSALEKFLLHIDKHKKTNSRLQQIPIAIVAICDGNNTHESEVTILDKIQRISSRVNSSLLLVDKGAPHLNPLKALVLHTLFPELVHMTMNEDDKARFCRLGPDTTEDGWAVAASQLNSVDEVANTSNQNTKDKVSGMKGIDLASHLENLAHQVLEEDPAIDVSTSSTSYFEGCAHVGDRRCKKCQEIRKQENEWLGRLKDFVSQVTKTSDGIGAESGTVEKAANSATGGDIQRNASNANLPSSDDGDATSFFQDLLTKN